MTQEQRIIQEEEKLDSQEGGKFKVPKYLKLLARKDYRYLYERPYRKPTQVDEEKILRRTREVLLRNSAN